RLHSALPTYPEGTGSPDGKLYRGRTGVARLALESRAPVVPMAMINLEKIMPPGRTFPKLGVRPHIKFGEPLDFSRYYGMERDPRVLRAVTDEIMYALMELSGQEYVDRYAQAVKKELEAEAKEARREQQASDKGRRRSEREQRKAERSAYKEQRKAERAKRRAEKKG